MSEAGPKSDDGKQEPVSVGLEEEVPREFTEEDINSLLETEAPELTKALTEIGGDKSLSLNEIFISDEEHELSEEIQLWQNSHGIRSRLVKVLPFLPRISLRIKKLKFRAFQFLRGIWVRLKNFGYYLATNGRTKAVVLVKNILHGIQEALAQKVTSFKALSGIRKLFAVGIFVAGFGTALFIYRSLTHGVIPEAMELFIPSLEAIASETYEFDPEIEVEPFYDNLRATQNLLLMPKLVVNLKRPTSGTANPMGAFEFFIEGVVPEVIVEVKDREAAVKDAMQRAAEEFSFESLETGEGKRALCERLRREINLLLTTGSVKRVLIKTIVLKP
jgi:hypothetical protein